MSRLKIIQCETRNFREFALLDCQNRKSCGKWVPHIFSGTRRAIKGGEEGIEEVYACYHCGSKRVWGFMDPELNDVN